MRSWVCLWKVSNNCIFKHLIASMSSTPDFKIYFLFSSDSMNDVSFAYPYESSQSTFDGTNLQIHLIRPKKCRKVKGEIIRNKLFLRKIKINFHIHVKYNMKLINVFIWSSKGEARSWTKCELRKQVQTFLSWKHFWKEYLIYICPSPN